MSSTVKTSLLDDPGVKTASRKFNSRPNRTGTLSYEELLPLFMDPGKSFPTIAKLAGTTRQAIHGLYYRRFKSVIDGLGSGRERHAARKLNKITAMMQTTDDSPAGLAARLARRHNLPFKRKIGCNGKPLNNSLEINGIDCYVLASRSSSPRKYGSWYNCFAVTIAKAAKAKMVICIVDRRTKKQSQLSQLVVAHTIPAKAFAQDTGVYRVQIRDEAKGQGTRTFPEERSRDWGQYKDKWHLFTSNLLE